MTLATVRAAGRLSLRSPSLQSGRLAEMDALGKLPAGTVVDGELVVLRDGRADLDAVLRRHQTTGRFKTKLAARQDPAVYVAFDLLFHRGQSLISEPLVRRREILAETLRQVDPCRAVLSDGKKRLPPPPREYLPRR